MARTKILILAALLMWQASPATSQGLLGNEPKILGMTKGSWAYFRDFNGRQLIYFTHLEVYRCGITAVQYSLNTEALDRVWNLQPCDLDKPHEITTDKPLISLPLGTAQNITVQLTFKDGNKSQIVRIGKNNKLIR